MACVLNLFVLSVTLLIILTGGSREFDALDKKINAIRDMLEVEIGMIKHDLKMVVKNLSISLVGEAQGKNGDVNTLQIANTMCKDPQNKILAAEDVYKVIQRGFSSEKLALRKSVSSIEQSVAVVQRQLENFNGELASLQTNFMKIVHDVKNELADIVGSVMNKSETLTQLQLINAEISRNKNDIEAKVEKAKHDAILKSNEDCKISNNKFNGELTSLQTNFMKIVNDVKKDVADINGSFINKSEALAKFQLLNTEINRNKNDIDAKTNKATQDAILKSKEDCKISIIKFASFYPHKYDGSFYFHLADVVDFSEASKRCKQYGAHLPHVTTSGENEFLKSIFDVSIFLDATDQLTEGRWVWEKTGQAVGGFQDWYPGEPNGLDGEDCLELHRWRKWNDIKCTEKRSIVCEMDF